MCWEQGKNMGRLLCWLGLLLVGYCSDVRAWDRSVVSMAPSLQLRGGGEGAGSSRFDIKELMARSLELSNLVKNMSDSARAKFPDLSLDDPPVAPQPSKAPTDMTYMTSLVMPLFAEAARDIAAAKPARVTAYLARWFMERASRDLKAERNQLPGRAISAGPPPHAPTDPEEGPGGNHYRTTAIEGDPLVHRPPGTEPLSVSFKDLGFDPTTGEKEKDAELPEGVVRAGEGGDSNPMMKGFLAEPKGLGEGAPGPGAGGKAGEKTTEQILAEAQRQRGELEDWLR